MAKRRNVKTSENAKTIIIPELPEKGSRVGKQLANLTSEDNSDSFHLTPFAYGVSKSTNPEFKGKQYLMADLPVEPEDKRVCLWIDELVLIEEEADAKAEMFLEEGKGYVVNPDAYFQVVDGKLAFVG